MSDNKPYLSVELKIQSGTEEFALTISLKRNLFAALLVAFLKIVVFIVFKYGGSG